jgi:hypothetical protein
MSLQVVMPPRSISAPASRLPSRTKAWRRDGFGGPDGFLQPAHQRQVVGEAAHQGHCCVAMQVDEAGGDDVLGQADGFGGGVARRASAVGSTATMRPLWTATVVLEGRVGGLDGNDPAGFDEQVDRCRRHGGGST